MNAFWAVIFIIPHDNNASNPYYQANLSLESVGSLSCLYDTKASIWKLKLCPPVTAYMMPIKTYVMPNHSNSFFSHWIN